MEIHWHWLIVIYLFLGGLGSGAYLTSFAAEKGWLGENSSLARSGYYLSGPLVAIGTIMLVFDLGQGFHQPWLLPRLILNVHSVMTWGVYILSAFIIVGMIKGYTVFKGIQVPAALTWTGTVLALATGTYSGLLLSVVDAVPFWNSPVMPFLFVVSGLSTGLSATCLLAPLVEKGSINEGREGQIHLGVVGLELIIVAIFIGSMLMGLNGPVGAESAEMVIMGSYAVVFWGYFVGLGLITPLIVYLLQFIKARKASKLHLTETDFTVAEQAGASGNGHHSYLIIFTDVAVLVAGLSLRALILFSAIPLWNGVTIL